jgi:uncharacterized protein (TIGR00369 family)
MNDNTQQLNQFDEGHFASHIGLVIDSAEKDRVEGHVDIDDHHTQPFGIVHGGVYCSIVETLASMGAFLTAVEDAKNAAGVENHTSFIRSIGAGSRVTAVATPIHRGRTMHLWEVSIVDERDRLVARGTVRLAILERRDGAAPSTPPATPAP